MKLRCHGAHIFLHFILLVKFGKIGSKGPKKSARTHNLYTHEGSYNGYFTGQVDDVNVYNVNIADDGINHEKRFVKLCYMGQTL